MSSNAALLSLRNRPLTTRPVRRRRRSFSIPASSQERLPAGAAPTARPATGPGAIPEAGDPPVARDVLEAADITRALTRIGHEIVERNKGADDLVLLGIPTRGVALARRLPGGLTPLEGRPVPAGAPHPLARAHRGTGRRDRRQGRGLGRRRAVLRADRAGRPRCAQRPGPAAHGAAGGSGRPRASRVTNSSRFRGPQPAHLDERVGAGAADRGRRHRCGPDRAGPKGGGGSMKRHLLSATDLTRDDALLVLDTAEELAQLANRPIKKLPTLRGRTVVNLFFEDSTRTRISFEAAAKRLSADVINFSAKGSSVSKGESLKDTALTLEAMGADAVVVRHGASGAPHRLAHAGWIRGAVVNAGDGTHEHPTQALLDAFTLRRHLAGGTGDLEGCRVAIVGDILHSRVARSNVLLLH